MTDLDLPTIKALRKNSKKVSINYAAATINHHETRQFIAASPAIVDTLLAEVELLRGGLQHIIDKTPARGDARRVAIMTLGRSILLPKPPEMVAGEGEEI